MTANVGRVIEYVPNSVTGTRTFSNTKYPMLSVTTTDAIYYNPGLVISIWARRDSVSGGYHSLIAPHVSGFSFGIKDNDMLVRSNSYQSLGWAQWTNQAPQDTQWHHYLIYFNNRHPFSVGNWYNSLDLYIDGVYLGEQALPSLRVATINSSGTYDAEFNTGSYVDIGNSQVRSITAPYDYETAVTAGDFLQLWIGHIGNGDSTRLDIAKFYDGGFRDLGSAGTATGLPAPQVYSRLSTPWTNITFNGTYSTDDKSSSQALRISDLSATSTLSAQPQAVLLITSVISAVAALSATGYKTLRFSSALAATATQSAVVRRTRTIVSTITTTAALTSTAYRTKQFAAAQSASVALTAQVGRRDQIAAAIQTTATLTCSVTVKPPIRTTAALTATATVAASAFRVKQFAATVTTTATVTANYRVFRQGIAQLTTTATLASLSGKRVVGSAALNVQGFTITVAEVLNIDPYLTLVVEPESRALLITQETRVITIESETRVNII